ncbi:MAG: four helix bundle protein [Nitrospinaceae bacterium]|nr:four helix bundle protein [Nitrospinaceae bacterium]NIR53444.1 four helix bundle protein [Nitrospinaceae bacterium]NIS83847.1 four helix bundle protein [Nitrospinaceae bacterium]NIT80638.1 four helix bundle protein [Nitrospinaceae bacterium]NIU42966.1 four helix bundle protein [Nitrospinaceae bacterium]
MPEKVERFEDLEVWKKSTELTVKIYKLLGETKEYGLRNQIQRAAVSIPSNIAEGFERQSNKEFIQYLYIAKGSCGELRTQFYIAKKVGLLDKETGKQLIDQTQLIAAMLAGLIKTRKNNF